jgi:DNA repair exonuclease SbcCD ATPase subunit
MLIELRAENFQPFEKLALVLPERGVVQISGVVLDEGFTDSNGSGKTSVRDLVKWTLFGVTRRGKADSVVNRKAKRNCSGYVKLRTALGLVEVTRYRKHKEHKNNCILELNGSRVEASGPRELQDKIDHCLGLDAKTYEHTVEYDSTTSLATLTDDAVKTLFERLIDIDVSSQLAAAKEYRTNTQLKHTQLTAELGKHVGRESASIAYLGDLQTSSDSWEQSAASRREEVTKQRQEAFAFLAALDAADLEAADHISTLEGAIRKSVLDVQARQEAATRWDTTHAQLTQNLAMQKDQPVSECCPTCQRPWDEHTRANYVAHKEAKIVSAQEALDKFYAEMKKPSETETARLQEELNNSRAALDSWHVYRNELAASRQTVTVPEEVSEVNPYTELIERTKLQIAEETKNKTVIQASIDEVSNKLVGADEVVKLFSNKGLRSYLLDLLFPYINEKLAQYLSVLTQGHLEASFSAQNAQGREKFTVEVQRDGFPAVYESLSMGERARLNFAVALAMLDRIRAKFDVPMVIFDELFDGLDRTGVDAVMELLRSVGLSTLVIVVSHNEHVRSHVSTYYKLVKKNGTSRLEDV